MTRYAWNGLVALLLLAAPARAASFLDRPYGTPEYGLSARSRAMGGAAAALSSGVYGLVDNPATLALEAGSRVDLTLGFARASEIRYVPLYDTFDSYVDDAAIAVNDHLYGAMNGGVVWDPRWRGLVVGAGVFDRQDPRYDYYDERRSTATTDQIVSERFIRSRGVLRSWALGGAIPIAGRGAAGVALHSYEGTLSDRDALVPRANPASGSVTELERRLSGWSVTIGGTFDVDERLRTALAIETPPNLHDDFTEWLNDSVVSPTPSNDDLRLPLRVQAGASYRPRNTLRTTFALDVIWMPWSEVDDPMRPDDVLLDTWDVRFGLEHRYARGVPARVGFRYARSYATREADRATFTFGVGYEATRFALDFSGEVGKAVSRQEPLWPRDEQGPAVGAGMDRVEDTVVRVFLGVRVTP